MKAMVINFGIFMMLLISCLCISSISHKQIIKEEINEAMSVSIRNTMELWVDNKGLSEEDLINNYLEVFEKHTNSDSEFVIRFYEVNVVDGMMDVEVEAAFKYPNRRNGSVSIRKTMIYDEKKY